MILQTCMTKAGFSYWNMYPERHPTCTLTVTHRYSHGALYLALYTLLTKKPNIRRPRCWGRAPGKPVGPSDCFVRLLPPPPPSSYSPNKADVVLFCVVQKQRFVLPFPPPRRQPMFFSFVQFSVLYSLETTQITAKFTRMLRAGPSHPTP